MAVLSRLDIEISANSARFQQELQNVSTTSRRAAAQLQRDQQQQAQSRLQIERQYASEHRRIEMSLTDEVERIRAARFNSADEQRYIAQARANAQQQVDLIAQQERATTGFADKAKAAYGYIAIAVGVAGAAIGALVRNQIEMTAELTKTAYIANTTVENIQKYIVAAKGMGIETDKLGDIFKDTQDKVGDFLSTGGGEMQDFFDNVAPKVGVTAEEFRKLSGPDALQLYFDSLQKANLSQSEMIFYMESVADEASLLIPYLKDGGKGFDIWATAAENAGATMDEKTIRATQELKTSTELLNLSVQGAKNQIAQAFMPILRDLAGELVKDAQFKNQAAAAGQAMAQGFKIIAMTGVGVIAIMSSIGKAIGGVLAAFAQFGRVAEGVDLTSPFAAFQIAKNVLWDIPTSQLTILKDTVVDVRDTLVGYDGLMTKINNLGNGATASPLVGQLTNLTAQSEKLRNATGKTGKALQDEADAKKANAKETERLAKANKALADSGKYAPMPVNSKVLAHASQYNYAALEKQYSLPAGLLAAISMQESRGNPNATSYVGAKGEFQFMPATARRFGIAGQERNTAVASEAAAKYLSQHLRMFGDLDKAIAAYNAGEGNVQKFKWDTIMSNRFAKGQTFDYVKNVRGYLSFMNGGKAIDGGYDIASAMASEAQAQQKLEEQKLALQAKYSVESERRAAEHAKNVAEIEKTYTNPNDPERKRLLDQEAADYAHDVNEYELAQAKKVVAFTDFKKSERELVIQNANFEARAAANDSKSTLEQKILAMDSIAEQRDLKLKAIDLQEAKERQAANAGHQTAIENIKAEAQLQRDELALNITMDANLRQAKIDAINQAEQVALDKARRDFESELSSITSYAKSEVQKIRDDFTARRSAIDMRADINDTQKSDLRNALAGQQNDTIRIARKSAADPYNSMMAEFNGTTELLNLKNQLDQRLEIIKKAKAEEVATVEQAERAKAKAEQNYWYASYQLQATQSANIIDSVANMGKIMFGETSSSYKRLFALSQSFVMAQAGLNMYKAISDGWAQGATLPQKLAAASVAAAEMLKIITAAQQIKMQGFMDGGYTGNIPTNARAGYVHGQEYVFDAPSTKAIGVKNLDRIRKGEGIGGDTNVNVNVTVNSDGSSSVESQQQLGKNIGDAVNAAIQKALLKERRQGGMLSGAR